MRKKIMHAVDKIRQYITDLPEGTPFSASALRSFASTDNIRQIITRLVKSGEINRVALKKWCVLFLSHGV